MLKISVIGLGAGDVSQMPLGVYEQITGAKHLYLRTQKHPVAQQLKERGVKFQSFDSFYEDAESFPEVYHLICKELFVQAKEKGEVLFAVPGHPMVAEQTTQLLLQQAHDQGVEVEILGGQSFLDAMFTAIKMDPVEGFVLLDALHLDRKDINPRVHTIITQVYDDLTASEVKLTLMEVFPDEYPVTLVIAAGVTGEEKIQQMPLYELDHIKGTHNLAAVYVPPTQDDKILNRQFSTLREIISILRSPEGCPWDREQTHKSIRKHLIEETYEVLETIDDDDPEAMCEEMGDLLMQVMLHSQIAEDDGDFTVEDVISVLNEKLVRRHPHVFGEKAADTSDEVLTNWDQIKVQEKMDKGIDIENKSLLDGIPRHLPALLTAYELAKKASKVGFDWDQVQDVYAKIEEEMDEVKQASNAEEVKEELGDLLFAVANLARFLKVDPEEALALTNRKFKTRFSHIEKRLQEMGKNLEEATLDEMEALWQEAKRT
ncbi:nucleoside triphosphate pyrophosphohydrolase [Ammoniphilus sp. CFH 90114]|uniref:nucleoside triphosphate pyrophosphohydrolase n=1 Tax=Ammoniphilus sp. CFH 90114 TaxID=2493665 RepID=UPI00100F830E|nr:nucleoside triphosphate pyrophosphohydrolase [Ammoniphilus sp. CFH 90114]RXT09011.1 nucleoside triphosphate pyrophosphohydrolase [Ammoniphilus sp. CFH 90114]